MLVDVSTNEPILKIPSHLVPPVPENYPLHGLDDYRIEKIQSLRTKFESAVSDLAIPMTQDYWNWADDACLIRYMNAANWDIEQALDRLVNTIVWRVEYSPDKISPSSVAKEAETGKQMISGFDKGGRPIMYLVPARENTKDYDSQLRYVVYGLEQMIKLMPPGVDKLVIIVDYENVGISTAPPVSVSRRFLQIIGDHYPDVRLINKRLHKAFVINPSWYLNVFFRIVRPFMDPITASKVNLVDLKQIKKIDERNSPEGSGGFTSILDHIDSSQLLINYGGQHQWDWNFDQYWKSLGEI